MTALAALPALRLPPAPVRRRSRWSVILSVLLHLALVGVAIWAARQRHAVPEAVPPAPVAMVFEGGGKTPPSVANPAPISPNQQASPRPEAATPPAPPPAPPAPRMQPTPKPEPQQPPEKAPPVETPQPTPPPVTPPQLKPTPPAPPEPVTPPQAAQPPPPPTVVTQPPPQAVPPPVQAVPQPKPPPPVAAPPPRPVPTENTPATNAPAAQIPAERTMPLPPPPPAPLPVPRSEPRPSPPRPREAVRPVRPSPAFPAPMDFSLGPPPKAAALAPTAPPRRRPTAGTMDLSFAPMTGGGDITQLHPNGKGDDVGADWFNEVSAWWIRHRFYPKEAANRNQEGDVTLRLKVAQSGHVEMLSLEDGSGSPWLDMGAEAVFRGADLPPLPGNVTDPNVTVNFTIHYEIVH